MEPVKSKILPLIEEEKRRQELNLTLIPSENYVSQEVLKALGSPLTNKYSEGFPGRRYYAGNKVIDKLEVEVQNLANKVFGTRYAIVQAYSGSPANLAVYSALLKKGDKVLGLALSSGGHLTHGDKASFTGKNYSVIQYQVEKDGKLNLNQVRKLVQKEKPKLIWVGGTAYPYTWDWAGFSRIAKEVGAYLVADISHEAGLIAARVYPSPSPFVHIITSTTHKSLRGPRGALILVTDKGLKKDPELFEKLEKAIFPGLQGGPHNHQTAAIGVALEEALKSDFKKYAKQILKNAQALGKELGLQTNNHLLLMDLEKSGYGLGMGYQAHIALEEAGIITNKNTVPGEKSPPFYPSGIRLGTPALTTRGMKEPEMKKIAGLINRVLEQIRGYDLPKSDRTEFIKNFRKEMEKNYEIKKVKIEVEKLSKKFPVYGKNN